MKIFAAIDIGSYELAMKIFEISKEGTVELDHIRYRLDLGSETYARGKMGYEHVEELCRVLKDFTRVMKQYKVDAYKAYATSAIRESRNARIILDQIKQRTGLDVNILSNSEQRFLDYKSIASRGKRFNNFIEKGTAIVDIGGGSIQISLFDKDTLVTTQNLRLGVLRLRESLETIGAGPSRNPEILEELIDNQLSGFERIFLKNHEITNIIVVDDYVSGVLNRIDVQKGRLRKDDGRCPKSNEAVDIADLNTFLAALSRHTAQEVAGALNMSEENLRLLKISGAIVSKIGRLLQAEKLWAPGVTLCDGIAYDYAEQNRLYHFSHDFEKDIVACAANTNKRYSGNKKRSEELADIALRIFDAMKKVHGLSQRQRLLLQIAAMMEECGKYISLTMIGECSYQIVMSTEIIGLSHQEREIVANTIRYTHVDFGYYEEMKDSIALDRDSYLCIAKLTAILRLADGLIRSRSSKYTDFSPILKDGVLMLNVKTSGDLTVEKGTFHTKADFFEEVYSIRPEIRMI